MALSSSLDYPTHELQAPLIAVWTLEWPVWNLQVSSEDVCPMSRSDSLRLMNITIEYS